MATLTINVPDAAVPRIRAAFGTPGAPATIAQVQTLVRDLIKARVLSSEFATRQQAITDAREAERFRTQAATDAQEVWP